MVHQVKMDVAVNQAVSATVVCHNLYVTIQNNELNIHYRNQHYKIGLDKVTEFYLVKKKLHAWIPGIERFLTPKYTLYVQTCDNKKITLNIRASDKQYFINAIYNVRHIKKSTTRMT